MKSYLVAVSASCSVALGLNAVVPRLRRLSPATKMILTRLVPFAAVASAGALNVFLMRGEEIRQGIDIYPVLSEDDKKLRESHGAEIASLGKSRKAAILAVGETAASRILNSTPIMVLPPLVLVRLQKTEWLRSRPRMVLPVNLGKPTTYWFTRSLVLMLTIPRADPHYLYLRATTSPSSLPPETSNRCQ